MTAVKMPKQYCVKHTVSPSAQSELVMQGVACIHSTLCASGSQQDSDRFDMRMTIALPCSLSVAGLTPVGPTV